MDLHEIARHGTRYDIQTYFEAFKLNSTLDSEEFEVYVASHMNTKNEAKYTPLHCSIFSRNLETFTYLVEAGCDVNSKCHGTSPLHLSIATAILPNGGYEFGLTCALKLISSSCDLNAKDDQGITPLQLAAKYNLCPIVENILRSLNHSEEEASETSSALAEATSSRDRRGYRAIHYAAFNDSLQAAKLLLPVSDITSTNSHHQTPLHVAGYQGSRGVWKAIVSFSLSKGSLANLLSAVDIFRRSPIDAAIYSGNSSLLGDIPKEYLPSNSEAIPAPESSKSTQTAILSHPYCRLHYTCPPSAIEESNAPPENVKRLAVLLDDDNGVLRGTDIESNVTFVEKCRPAAISDVLRVHEWSYVRKLQATCEELASRFGKSLKDEGGEDEEAEHDLGIAHLDSDTAISKRSFEAALFAAGSLCQAVDMILSNKVRNAFCAVRPPGHHAGPCGLISGPDAGAGAESHGFCLLNNVSIGAAYAMNVYRETIKKVAIVDFDVHHGNGTEETIRWLNPGLTTVDVLSANIFGQLHTPRYKPWFDVDDAKNVLFVSVHGYGPRERGYERFMPAAAFYPGTGKTCVPQDAHGKEEESFDGSNTLPPALSNAVSTQSSLSTSSERGEEHQILEEIRNNEDGDDNDDDEDDSSFSDQDQVDEDSPDEDVELQAEILKSMQSSPYSRLLNTHNFQKPTSNSYAPPLVLDIGVNLADEEMVQGEYRHQWRNYFRDIIFPKLMDFKPDCIFISAGFDAHKKDLINSGYISLVEEDYEWVTANLMKIANATCNGRIISALEGGYQLGGEHCSAFAKSVKCHVATLCSPGLRASEVKYDPVEAEREKSEERLAINSIKEKKEAKRIEAEMKLSEWRQMRHQQHQESHLQESNTSADKEESDQMMVIKSMTPEAVSSLGGEISSLPLPVPPQQDNEETGRNKRRRTSKVDYVALNKEIFPSGA